MAKRSYHHGDLRRTLLDAAIALLESEGLAALSLREVARRAGVTHGAPYHHFQDRAALLSAIASEGFELLRGSMEGAQAAVGPRADERLGASGRGYVGFALRHPAHFRVMFRPELAGLPGGGPEGGGAYQLLVDTVLACQREGLAPQGDPAPLVLLCWSAVHGLASLWLDGSLAGAGREPGEGEALAAQLAGTLTALMASGAPRKVAATRKAPAAGKAAAPGKAVAASAPSQAPAASPARRRRLHLDSD